MTEEPRDALSVEIEKKLYDKPRFKDLLSWPSG